MRRIPRARRFLVSTAAIGAGATVCVVVQAALVASVVDLVFLRHAGPGAVVPRLVALGGAFAGRAALSWAGEVTAQGAASEITAGLRRQLLEKMLALGPSWVAGRAPGALAVEATRGIDALEVYVARYVPQAVVAALAPVAVLVWVAWADPLSAGLLAATAVVVPVFMALLGLQARDRTEAQWQATAGLGARFLDLVQGLPTLRAFGRERDGRRELERSAERLRVATLGTLRVAFLSSLALELLASVGIALVALFLGLRLLDGTVPFAVALAVLVVAPEVYLPLRRAAAQFHASVEGRTSARGILDVLAETVASRPGPSGAPPGPSGAPPGPSGAPPGPSAAARTGTAPAARATPAIECAAVTVRYPDRDAPALDRFDLTVARGEHVALVGPSGAGKSSVLSVLLAFVTPEAGTVRAGGVDLSALHLPAWRRRVAWVPQRPYLVHGSLGENLRLGTPGARPGDVEEAVARCGLSSLVGALPDGLDTPVGEGGATLSAGERQRVALARAVLRDAPIVLLDEPADHLDEASEEELRASLLTWLAGRTVVVAAHRRRLVATVDRTVHLRDGQVVAVAGAEPGQAEPGQAEPGAQASR